MGRNHEKCDKKNCINKALNEPKKNKLDELDFWNDMSNFGHSNYSFTNE